jgi:cyanophycin synthetase
MDKHIPIISVTGTKGKTTTVAIIADVLQKLNHNVLKVDTVGHYVNGVQKSTLDDSKDIWRLVPSVAPGRYLYEFFIDPGLQKNGVAVLECSLGSSALPGMGYRYHNVGVFLNVYEDHIGNSERIKSKEDIAKAKAFIFKRLTRGSHAVFNADDELVCQTLKALPKGFNINLLPCGFDFSYFDLKEHLSNRGKAITIDKHKNIVIRSQDGDEIIFSAKDIPWTFNGEFMPSLWNLMHAAGAVYGFYKGRLPKNIQEVFEAVRLDKYSGRLTVLESDKGVKIIADYAHEKVSINKVAELARSMVSGNGQTIGIVRLAQDRTEELIVDTGKTIADSFDKFIVYDKIDGYWRQPKEVPRFPEEVGKIAQILYKAIKSKNPNVERIIREDQAIERAAKIAKKGDVVVIIVNDNIKRSIDFIQKYFKAEFL